MALNSSRSALRLTRAGFRQCRCSRSPQSVAQSVSNTRALSSTVQRAADLHPDTPAVDGRPRWSYTPEQMKGPGFSINVVKDPRRKIWVVNEDPKKLDAMYNRLLGPNGERMLPDEIKWLAVTHKSFDQGRRGFNTRLAYFGRLIMAYETTRSILVNPSIIPEVETDTFGREPFRHAALDNVDKLIARQPQDIIEKGKLARLAGEVGLPEVIRWKPRMPENLEGSGVTIVLDTAIYAIVGGISLQHGAEVAGRVAREKILRRLGP